MDSSSVEELDSTQHEPKNCGDLPRSKTNLADDFPKVKLVVLICLVRIVQGSDVSLHNFMMDVKVKYRPNQDVAMLIQGGCTFVGGLFWGILASMAVLSRRQVLIAAVLLHGIAAIFEHTLAVTAETEHGFWLYITSHSFGIFCWSAIHPLSRSVVLDVFPAQFAGRMIGLLYASYVFGFITYREFVHWLAGQEAEDLPFQLPGWRACFLYNGCISLLLAVALYFTLEVPADVASFRTFREELARLKYLVQLPTFAVLIMQGVFGSIPWYIMSYQYRFFELVPGLSVSPSVLHMTGQVASAIGSIVGGNLGDRLARRSLLHGRITAAQISIFSGIPLSYLLYAFSPEAITPKLAYYLPMVVVFGFMITWADSATNAQILSSISESNERTLAFTGHWAIEQAFGSLGMIIFFRLVEKDWNNDSLELTQLRWAMFWTSAIPWLVCGLLYSMLHWTYPRDIERTIRRSCISRMVEVELTDESVANSFPDARTLTGFSKVSELDKHLDLHGDFQGLKISMR